MSTPTWSDSETRRCANGQWYSFAAIVLALVILGVVFTTGYLFGKSAGIKRTLAEFDNQLEQAMLDGGQLGIDETLKQLGPALDTYNELATALLADLQAERQRTNEFAQRSAEWLYSEPRDPMRAYDLLWCAAGKASPLDNCLQMLAEGRGD
jgi:hypothetical protein